MRRSSYFASSIFRKQMVAASGLVLVLFLLVHLGGNFLLFEGAARFNAYAASLQSLGGLLWAIRFALAAAAIVHVSFAVLLTVENRQARDRGYAVRNTHGNTNFVRKTMIYSGSAVFLFLFLHLSDYAFGDRQGPGTVIAGVHGGESLGLFGLVWNSFRFAAHGWRPVVYILAVTCAGAHLTHGIQSIFQTFGFNHARYTPWIRRASIALGIAVGTGFALIPLLVNIIGTPRP